MAANKQYTQFACWEQKWIVGNWADKVKFHQVGSLNYHNWRPWRWGRIWQLVQNVILWSTNNRCMIMHDCPGSCLTSQEELWKSHNLASVSFSLLSIFFLKKWEKTGRFQSHWPWNLCVWSGLKGYERYIEERLQICHQCLLLCCQVFGQKKKCFFFLPQKMLTAELIMSSSLHTQPQNQTGKWIHNRRDVTDQNTSPILVWVFFLGQDHTNTCSSWEETRGFEEPSVNQSLWEAH